MAELFAVVTKIGGDFSFEDTALAVVQGYGGGEFVGELSVGRDVFGGQDDYARGEAVTKSVQAGDLLRRSAAQSKGQSRREREYTLPG
jgi:hypothetical protein